MSKPEPSVPKSLLYKPRTQLVLFIFTVIYILSPIDFIPDIAPLVGWFDDVAVLLTQIVSFILYLKNKRQKFEDKEKEQESEHGN
jgi:uncharacterized membrane protein YkvA (DUF1232 family)